MHAGPIIFVEDDIDDQEIFTSILEDLEVKNQLIWFNLAEKAFEYLKTTTDSPFIIFSDVNLPKLNGIEFKRRIDTDHELREKSIPFVFYTTSVSQSSVNEAYTKMTVQGFFQKGSTYDEIKKHLQLILEYWQICRHPNSD